MGCAVQLLVGRFACHSTSPRTWTHPPYSAPPLFPPSHLTHRAGGAPCCAPSTWRGQQPQGPKGDSPPLPAKCSPGHGALHRKTTGMWHCCPVLFGKSLLGAPSTWPRRTAWVPTRHPQCTSSGWLTSGRGRRVPWASLPSPSGQIVQGQGSLQVVLRAEPSVCLVGSTSLPALPPAPRITRGPASQALFPSPLTTPLVPRYPAPTPNLDARLPVLAPLT